MLLASVEESGSRFPVVRRSLVQVGPRDFMIPPPFLQTATFQPEKSLKNSRDAHSG